MQIFSCKWISLHERAGMRLVDSGGSMRGSQGVCCSVCRPEEEESQETTNVTGQFMHVHDYLRPLFSLGMHNSYFSNVS